MRAARIKKGLTTEEVGKLLGVHDNAVQRWERGEAEPMGSNLIALSKLYGVSPDKLMKQGRKRKWPHAATAAR